ncbi:MAG: polysaccharide deacetylase family protein, partial [Candidatus Acidiferrales bacterium]
DFNGLSWPPITQEIPICLTPGSLAQNIDKALALNYRSAGLQVLRKELFDSTDGKDAARTARMIYEFIEQKRRSRWSTIGTDIHCRKRRLAETCGTTVRRLTHPALTLRNSLRRFARFQLPILLYHNVGPVPVEDPFRLTVPPEEFERQMSLLVSRGYEAILPSEWLARRREGKPPPRKSVLLTFDDGYADLAEYALPVLCEKGLKAAVYVVTTGLGLTNTWDEANGDRTMLLMSADQIREWAGKGIEFGSHSRTHPHLTALSAQELTDEIEGSRDDLETLLGAEVLSFAYPYGDGAESSIVREHLSRTYQLGMTISEGRNPIETNPYELRRVAILPGESMWDFECKLRFGQTLATWAREHLPWTIWTAARLTRHALRAR